MDSEWREIVTCAWYDRIGKTWEEIFGEEKAKVMKAKLSLTQKGKPKPFLAGENNYWYGKHLPEEVRMKMSLSHKKNPPLPPSKETAKKISLTIKKHWKNPKYRKHMVLAHIGKQAKEKHPNWQGGISFEPYGEEFTKKLKENIRERDGRLCQLCFIPQNKFKEKLIVHHIDFNKKNNSKNNLISLCRKCHLSLPHDRKIAMVLFSAKENKS